MDRASLQERFGIIGQSEGIRHVLDRIRQVARTEITVLIQGESGTGKELFVQAIHQLSERRRKPVAMVNCGAIPEGLIESELFGNEKGAYTGAVERRHGYFEEANGSSLFLDEIGEMPLTAQVRLLRVLETGQFSRVGSSSTLRSDVRVIAATNKDLGQEVRAGRFREDLYYRLSTVIIEVPPLRDRRDDILTLFEHFQKRFAEQYNTPHRRLDDSARQLLLRYRWPGNVRELRNVAEQTAVFLRGDSIGAEDVRQYLRGVTSGGGDIGLLPVAAGPKRADGEDRERELIYHALMELRAELRDVKDELSALSAGIRGTANAGGTIPRRSALIVHRDAGRDDLSSLIEDVPFEIEGDVAEGYRAPEVPVEAPEPVLPTLDDAERRLIAEALERFEGNRRQTAKALGISERTLYRKLKEFGNEND